MLVFCIGVFLYAFLLKSLSVNFPFYSIWHTCIFPPQPPDCQRPEWHVLSDARACRSPEQPYMVLDPANHERAAGADAHTHHGGAGNPRNNLDHTGQHSVRKEGEREKDGERKGFHFRAPPSSQLHRDSIAHKLKRRECSHRRVSPCSVFTTWSTRQWWHMGRGGNNTYIHLGFKNNFE